MPAQQKPKSSSSKTMNDSRPNKKKNKGDHPHTRGVNLTEIQKVLLGGAGFRRLNGVGSDPSTQNMKSKAR